MLIKDILTIGLSSVALLVSLTSLYFNIFYRRISGVGMLVAWNSGTEIPDLCQVCEFSLSNTGNKELLLREVFVTTEPERSDDTFPILDIDNVPIVIKPGELKLFYISLSDRFLMKINEKKQKMKFQFHVISSDATAMIGEKVISPITDDAPKEDWQPFSLRKLKI